MTTRIVSCLVGDSYKPSFATIPPFFHLRSRVSFWPASCVGVPKLFVWTISGSKSWNSMARQNEDKKKSTKSAVPIYGLRILRPRAKWQMNFENSSHQLIQMNLENFVSDTHHFVPRCQRANCLQIHATSANGSANGGWWFNQNSRNPIWKRATVYPWKRANVQPFQKESSLPTINFQGTCLC